MTHLQHGSHLKVFLIFISIQQTLLIHRFKTLKETIHCLSLIVCRASHYSFDWLATFNLFRIPEQFWQFKRQNAKQHHKKKKFFCPFLDAGVSLQLNPPLITSNPTTVSVHRSSPQDLSEPFLPYLCMFKCVTKGYKKRNKEGKKQKKILRKKDLLKNLNRERL